MKFIQIGDQILEVNSQSFLDVTHDEAVSQLKYHKRMALVVRDVGKVPHSCTSVETEPFDAYNPTESRFVSFGYEMKNSTVRCIPWSMKIIKEIFVIYCTITGTEENVLYLLW